MPQQGPKCQKDGCELPPRFEGWCHQHRYGTCEYCGNSQATARAAIGATDERGGTRLIGMPLLCDVCHPKFSKQNEISSAAPSWKTLMEVEQTRKPTSVAVKNAG